MTEQENNRTAESPQLIPPHGGYADLQSYRMSEIVYDGTVRFCDRFISKRSSTHDQMVQAARSGKHLDQRDPPDQLSAGPVVKGLGKGIC